MRARLLVGVLVVTACQAFAGAPLIARQIGMNDTALLFGGGDAEGGLGDWYLSNGTVEAIIDDAGPTPDLIGIVPAGTEPRLSSSAAPTGGNLIDLGRDGANDDQLSQMFTVGGLSTENFVLYDTVRLDSHHRFRHRPRPAARHGGRIRRPVLPRRRRRKPGARLAEYRERHHPALAVVQRAGGFGQHLQPHPEPQRPVPDGVRVAHERSLAG
jgi:hypothetical protein